MIPIYMQNDYNSSQFATPVSSNLKTDLIALKKNTKQIIIEKDGYDCI